MLQGLLLALIRVDRARLGFQVMLLRLRNRVKILREFVDGWTDLLKQRDHGEIVEIQFHLLVQGIVVCPGEGVRAAQLLDDREWRQEHVLLVDSESVGR